MKDLRHSLLRYGPKRPGGASLPAKSVSASVFVPDSVSSKKTTHKVFELAAKLEIINISESFVARFREIAKEKHREPLLKSC
jgi:hypothetical protein